MNRLSYLAITGSWITDDWELEAALLDFIQLHGSHSGANMAKVTHKGLEELDICEKVGVYL